MSQPLKPGDRHYRAYVGDPKNYDLIAATTFNLLTVLGLRDHHRVLDVGCGSLRNGRLLMPYLRAGGYEGIEPNQWLVEEGVREEVGEDLIRLKQARFHYQDHARNLSIDRPFDFILLQSIFSHCGEDLIEQWLKELEPLLAPEGIMVFTWKDGKQDSGEQGWLYPGLVHYRPPTFDALLERSLNGYWRHIRWPHPMQRWTLASPSQARLEHIAEQRLDFRSVFPELHRPTPPQG